METYHSQIYHLTFNFKETYSSVLLLERFRKQQGEQDKKKYTAMTMASLIWFPAYVYKTGLR